MRTVMTVIGGIFLIAALYVTVMNWACAIISLRNKRKGVDRHHSMVPLVSLMLAFCVMFMLPHWPGIWALLIPALDIANLSPLFAPIYLTVNAIRKRGSEGNTQE